MEWNKKHRSDRALLHVPQTEEQEAARAAPRQDGEDTAIAPHCDAPRAGGWQDEAWVRGRMSPQSGRDSPGTLAPYSYDLTPGASGIRLEREGALPLHITGDARDSEVVLQTHAVCVCVCGCVCVCVCEGAGDG